MSEEFKKAQIRFAGDGPLSLEFAEDGTPHDLSPEQQAALHALVDTIRSYLRAAKDLLSGKYKNLAEIAPRHLTDPGNVAIALCPDGVVIRFENNTGAKRGLIGGVMPEGIAHAALVFSQNLIRIRQPGAPAAAVDDSLGVEMRIVATSPSADTSRDIIAARIWLDVTNYMPAERPRSPHKPYCLTSVQNSLEFEIEGETEPDGSSTTPGKAFIVRSTIRFNTGWECIEVFPGFDISDWNPEYAPIWAELDLLSAALTAQFREEQNRSLDPHAATRKKFAALLDEFRNLLDSDPEREQTLQTFLQSNPSLLCPAKVDMWPKQQLGAHVTDFIFRDAANDYVLVELERSTLALFRRDGHPSADLTHAQGQIVDWKRYLEDNLPTVQRELGLDGITPNPSGLVVIGRSASLDSTNRRKLQTMMNESPKLKIMTYDDVYENAKAVIENILGPIWEVGPSTQIFFPERK